MHEHIHNESMLMELHDHKDEWWCQGCTMDDHEGVLLGPMWVAYQVVVPTLVVLGVIGNVLCLVVLAKPHVRALHVNRYFLFMAVMDLLSCLFVIPVSLTISGCVFTSRHIAYYYAYLGWAVPEILQIISFCVIVFLSYDRCLAIYLPAHFKEIQNHKVFRNRIIGIVTFSIFLHLPVIALGNVEELDDGKFIVTDGYRSMFDNPFFKIYSAFKEVLDYVGPSIIQMMFHIALVVAMVKTKFIHEDEELERKKFVLNVTIISMGLFYLVTSMPVCIYNFYYAKPNNDCCHGEYGVEVFRGIANCFKLSQNVFNIIFIVILNKTFKKEFLTLFPKCCSSDDENPILDEDSGQSVKKYNAENFGFKRDSTISSPSINSHMGDSPGRHSYLHNSYKSSLKKVPENISSCRRTK
ncbi:unnamed protein product, partial [Meganyctiphanes norvegica]